MIVGAHPSTKGAVGQYRITQPLTKLDEDDNDHICAVRDENLPAPLWDVMSHKFDVFVYQYPQLQPQLDHIKFMSSDPNTLTVVEIDDDVWNMDARQENYEYFGTKEVKINGKWLYKDGKDGWDLKKNQERMGILAACLIEADLVTVTTPELKEIITKHLKSAGKENPQIAVLPNSVALEHYDPVELVKDELRIMWSGGHGHRHDLREVVKPLKEVIKKHNVKIVFAGNSWPEIEKELGKENLIVNKAWTGFDAHPYRLKLLGADIAIAPLTDVPFNHAKSEIKFVEASSLQIPTVASPTVYSKVIEHEKTGFIADSEDAWVEHLSRLLEDAELRKTIGANARKFVEKHRDANKTKDLWIEAYDKALKRKKTPSLIKP